MVDIKKKRTIKYDKIALVLALVIVIVLIVLSGKEIEDKVEIVEESVGSGFLEVETLPVGAEIYIDNEYKGISPTTLYNIPIGIHNIILKKSGYDDFTGEVTIKSGKKSFLEADLLIVDVIEEKPETSEIIEEQADEIGIEEKEQIEDLTGTLKTTGVVDIGRKILQYYDFSEEEFTPNKKLETDIFSKRYGTYLVFTRYSPVNIKVINKNIKEVKKEDCIGIRGQYEFLHSGDSLCVITKEQGIVVMGGEWSITENAELKWKVFS